MITKKKASRILEKRAKKEPKGLLSIIFKWSVILSFIFLICAGLVCFGIYLYIIEGLPKISGLTDYNPPIITTVYSDDNRKIAEFYNERRILCELSDIPKMLQDAFVAAEDARFYQHKGIDVVSIMRAFIKNLKAGAIVQGGSTITQQVTKSFFLTPERSYTRKIKEAILSYNISKKFTKEEILYLYLNQIYFGHGAYGVQAASENYFGKSVNELNLAEAAMLAGLPQAPSRYSPFSFPEKAKQRQIYVLNRMLTEGYITNIQASEAINKKLDIKKRRNWYIEEVPYYAEYVRQYIERKYGKDALYEEGYEIYTAVNIEMQKAAQREVKKGLKLVDKRQGYRGPLKHLEDEEIETYSKKITEKLQGNPPATGSILTGVVISINNTDNYAAIRMGNVLGRLKIENMRWARKPDPDIPYYNARVYSPGEVLKIGDVIYVKINEYIENMTMFDLSLEQTPDVQAALLCMEAGTSHVKVMVGGRDFKNSQFNRAIQSKRQPGSAFKPIIYAAAIDKGYTPATVLIDSPIVFHNPEDDFPWKPSNYKKKFYGPILLREAIEKSRNVVTIKILQDIGIDYLIDYARKMGISSHLSRDLSIALGSSGISLLESIQAYSVFCNSGYLVQPVFITKIMDRNGNIVEEAEPVRKKVIEKTTAYIMTSLLEGVVKHGTGRRVRALKRPVAGKTGTTNNLFDAWFVGYTPGYITGVWVGFDNEKSLGEGETGSRAASPIWIEFMRTILSDKPARIFSVPEDIVFSKIDAKTGLLPISETEKTIFECFKEGTAPAKKTPKPGSSIEDLYKKMGQ